MDTASLVAAVRHRWWVVVLCAVLGVVGAGAAVQLIPSTYEATTTLLVTPTGAEDAATAAQGTAKVVNLETEAQIVTSAAVADRVKDALKTPRSTADLADDVTVEVPPNTTLLSITAVATTPADAQKESRTFADEYLKQRAEVAAATIGGQVKIYQARIDQLNKRLQAVSGQSRVLPQGSPDRAYAELQQRILVDQITGLSEELSKLQAITVSPGRVLSRAALPEVPQQSSPAIYVAAGLLLGLVLGLAVTLLMAKLDRRVRWPGDIQALGHVPLLGAIPSGKSKRAPLPSVAPSASPIGQAFGQIRNAITTALPTRPATLLVAGTEPGPAASVVAANLSVALARSGVPVLMVCADLAGSSTERLLGLEGLSPANGLAEALTTDIDPGTLLRASPAVRGLWVLGAGVAKAEAADLLQSRQFEWVLSVVTDDHYVVIEAPPTSVGAEAQAMARLCDAAALVVEAGRTHLDAVDEGARQLARVGTPLLGAVMVERQAGSARKPAKARPVAEPAQPDAGASAELPETAAGRRAAALPSDPTIAIKAGDLAELRAATAGFEATAGVEATQVISAPETTPEPATEERSAPEPHPTAADDRDKAAADETTEEVAGTPRVTT
jgi:capsular polysaccharide biosynthesis protein